MRKPVLIVLISCTLTSCLPKSDESREAGKIFHAVNAGGGVSNIYFSLFKDKSYQICLTGGVSQDCFEGSFQLNGDTVSLHNLPGDLQLKFSKMIIRRYDQMDSSYWRRKYSKSDDWQVMRDSDKRTDTIGDILSLSTSWNVQFEKPQYFVILLDSLSRFR